MDRAARILTSIGFIAGLLLLLTNDFVLKQAYPGLLTGKLSDFAGLFIFPMFWAALCPRRAREIYIATAVGFVWWKSPLSQGAIDAWSATGPYQIGRVVDYGDLLALVMLRLSWLYLHRASVQLSTARRIQLRTMPAVMVIAGFAFAATSNVSFSEYDLTPGDPDFAFRLAFPIAQFPERLDATGLGHSGPGPESEKYSVAFDECKSAAFNVQGDGSHTTIGLTRLSSHCDEEYGRNDLRMDFEDSVVSRLRGDRDHQEMELPDGDRLDYEDVSLLVRAEDIPFSQIGALLDAYPEGHRRQDGVYTQSLGFGYYVRFRVMPLASGTEFTVLGYINNFVPLLGPPSNDSESTPEEMEPRFEYFLDFIAGHGAEAAPAE